MARITEQTIEQIRSIADIQDVIGRYVQLKKRGKNWFAPCPFHNEKTGSFSVSPERQMYKCFGCGVGGSVINFIQKIENLEFVDSLKFLAEMYNIKIQWDGNPNLNQNLTQQLYEIHDIAWDFYRESLKKSKKNQQYLLNDRKLSIDTIRTFQLGVSPNNWQGLLDILKDKKFSSDAIKESGLIISGEKGYFDRFRNRIMFSLANEMSKIIGFAGRSLDPNDNAKYMNSPESPIYHKSNFLYGLNKSKNYIPKKDQALVVEGYLDYLQLYQHGFNNGVAVSGTAFTQQHARKLKRYTENIVLVFDGDSAGIKAAIRSGYVLALEGVSPKIIEMPEGLDPDDMMVKGMQKDFENLLQNARPLIEFHFTHFEGGTGSTQQLNAFARESILEISRVNDPIFRELLIRELADVSKFREENLYEKLSLLTKRNQNRLAKIPIKKTETIVKIDKSRRDKIEEEITQLCFVEDAEIRTLLYDNIQSDWFKNTHTKHIFDNVFIHLHGEITPDANVVMDGLNEIDRNKLSELIFELDEKKPTLKLAKDCITVFETLDLKSKLNMKREELNNQPSSSNVIKILKQISEIQSQIKEIKTKYN
ncbi:MAG: DNA primase [Candidatus Marinimicrobia bacterium]|nr:DNA primase [Candidatus Neomarinimicrobiota bacterium]